MSKAKETTEKMEMGEDGYLDMTDRRYVIKAKENKVIFCDSLDEYDDYMKGGTGNVEVYKYTRKLTSYKKTENEKEKNTFVLFVLEDGNFIQARKWKTILQSLIKSIRKQGIKTLLFI